MSEEQAKYLLEFQKQTKDFENFYVTLPEGIRKNLWRNLLDARKIQLDCMVALTFPELLEQYEQLQAANIDPHDFACAAQIVECEEIQQAKKKIGLDLFLKR